VKAATVMLLPSIETVKLGAGNSVAVKLYRTCVTVNIFDATSAP
jgi:hypothetical protein